MRKLVGSAYTLGKSPRGRLTPFAGSAWQACLPGTRSKRHAPQLPRLFVVVMFFVLGLAACADTPEPTQPSLLTSTATPSTEQVPLLTESTSDVHTTPSLASPTPLPTTPPIPAGTPWPHFLREIDFGIAAGNSYGPRALAVHPGLDRIYARTHSQDSSAPGRVTVLDRETGDVLAIAETGLDSYAEGNVAIDPVHNRLYVVNADEATATILDTGTLKPIETLQGVDALALDGDTGQIYVAGLGGLRILDATRHNVLQETSVAYAPRFLAVVLGSTNQRVYLAYQEAGGYVLSQYHSATLQPLASTDLPGRPDDLVADPNRDLVYVSLNHGEQNLLWTLDGEGQLLAERSLGEWMQRTYLALDHDEDRLFLAREVHNNYGITVLDLSTGRDLADIPLDLAPNALVWDADAGQLLVSHTYADKIGIVDVQLGRAVFTFPTALDLVDLAVDPERGQLYSTDSAGRLHILDSDTDQKLAVLPGQGAIAVDSPHGRVYTGGTGATRLRVFDAEQRMQLAEIHTTAKPVADAHSGGLYLVQNGIYLASLETLTFTMAISDTLPADPGFSPNPAAVDAVVDPDSGRVFAIINNGVPGSNGGTYLYVYEPETYRKVLTDTERSPVYLDVDPTTGRAYVSRIHLAGQSTSLLEDGEEYTARLEAVFGALRVDPNLGYLYLSVGGQDEGYLLVLDAANLDVLGSVPIPGGFSLRALDPRRHILYLATPAGRVQIWSAYGGKPPPPAEPASAQPPAQEIYRHFSGPGDTSLFTGSLYRSDDQSRSWYRIDNGLPGRGVQTVAVSPGFAQDRTLFVALLATDEGLGIWSSTDGGRSWRMSNRGLNDLAVTDLAISPNFATDRTLFATTRRAGLFRSTDAGQHWIRLTEDYFPAGSYPRPANGVFVSPTYAQDSTLFVTHDGLYRSTDGGDTWNRVFAEMPVLAFSPDFATDRTLFGWSSSNGVLRSLDGGATWQSASLGLVLSDFGWGRVIVSPDFSASQTVYFIWTPTTPDAAAQFFRSTDGAQTWQRLIDASPEAKTPVELSADGRTFVALDENASLVSWPVDQLTWKAATLPPIDQIEIYQLVLSPDLLHDRTLYALSAGAGVLRSTDGGLTWSDTGFPLRASYGLPPELVISPPPTLFVGTPMGLYRSTSDGGWALVNGGLPQGLDTSSPQIGADGSLRVLVAGEGERAGQMVLLSADGGQTWTQPIPALPKTVVVEDLGLSPALAADRTAYLGPAEGKPWRSIGGTEWEEFGPPGQWDLSAMNLSPTIDQDKLLFIRLQDNSLWRSADGGDSWTEISGPWDGEAPLAVTAGTRYKLDALTFSPAFDQDHVILTQAGATLYRTVDQGTRWTKVLDVQPLPAKAVFTPNYAQNGGIYLLQGRSLYRSLDRGERWQPLPSAPWDESEEVTLILSPTFPQDDTLVAWTLTGGVYQSSDGGQSWRDISRGLPAVGIRQVLFSLDHAADGTLYLVPHGPGLYVKVGESPWRSSSAGVPAATVPAPPTPAPAPTTCATEPSLFLPIWQQAHSRMGCPQQPAEPATLAEQPFERGRMLWDASSRQIYVLLDSGTWQAFDDTFVEGVDPAYDPALPPPPEQPQRGFGKVWREQLSGPQAAIGWALENERPVSGWRQLFDRAMLVWTDASSPGTDRPGTAYLLFDDGTWQALPAAGP